MSEPTAGAAPAAPLQFDTVEPAAAGATPLAASCTVCKQPITGVYHQANGQVVCSGCRARVEAQMAQSGSYARALALGAGGGIAGAAVWYGVAALTGYEIGIIAILMGWLVGRGVNMGSGGRGGRGYQVLALGLTYLSICAAYAPFLAAGVEGVEGGVGAVALVIMSLVAPVVGGIESPLFLIIAGVGFYEAWRQNQRVVIEFTGPHRVSPAPETEPGPQPQPALV